MKILTNFHEIDQVQWRKLLNHSKYASFFQTPECYNFYARQAFLEPFAFGIEYGGLLKCVIVGYIQKEKGLLKSYLSRRAIINAGPVFEDTIETSYLVFLLNELRKRLEKKAIYIEIRNYFNYDLFQAVFNKSGFKLVPHLNFQINTMSEDVVNANLSKSHKRYIKVSLRDGASLITNPSEKQVKEFYDILNNLYKTKVKTPLFPLSFFLDLNNIPEGHLIMVMYSNRIVGGIVGVGILGQPLYEWFVCGLDGVHKNIHASILATYGGIQYAVQNGFPVFDMMGAGKPDEKYGVRDFKAKFGGRLVKDGRYLAVLNPFLYKLGAIGVEILKKL